MIGIYSDPRHVILYASNDEVRQGFSIVLTASPLSGLPTPQRVERGPPGNDIRGSLVHDGLFDAYPHQRSPGRDGSPVITQPDRDRGPIKEPRSGRDSIQLALIRR